MTKWVYKFHEGDAVMRNFLGDKGCSSAEMTSLGIPILQGFTVTAEACTEYYNCGGQISQEIQDQISEAITWLEGVNGEKSGDTEGPLLVSIRSGARASMPGMVDTVLNLGLSDVAVEGFAKKAGSPRFTYDSYHRFVQIYPDVVMEIPGSYFEKIIDEIKGTKDIHFGIDLTADDLKELAAKLRAVYKDVVNGEEFPQNPTKQLVGTVKAMFCSWDNPRTIVYHRMNDIPGDWGTAVNVQTMVFGNKGETSGTGVAFIHSPSTGAKRIYDEYPVNAQGEDVVAGVHTPRPISKLIEDLPECYKEFMDLATKLEDHFRDIQDMGFTIEEGKLYFLQTRNGERAAPAVTQIACDLVNENMIAPEEAVCRIETKSLDQPLHLIFVPEALKAGETIGSALLASPGTAASEVYFTADEARGTGEGGRGERVILVRLETSPENIEGMYTAQGILTVRGGMTSHTAVVARGMGTCCVSGCGEIKIDEEAKVFELGGHTFCEGDYISPDDSTGKICKGDVATQKAIANDSFECIMRWADQLRTLRVRTNADTSIDTLDVVKLGAGGIGLRRTERMLFDVERIPKIHKMILSKITEQREEALDKLIPFQKDDFKTIYKALEGGPMTVRHLGPPLHEFVPTDPEGIKVLTDDMGVIVEAANAKYTELHEFSPMMGHRGCRLAVTYPEIIKMQTRAAMEATIEAKEECGHNIVPEIMVPLISEKKELRYVENVVIEIAELVKKEKSPDTQHYIGTMTEIPRAALAVGKVAEEADLFSFGTNGLTQMTFGFSCDNAGKFLGSYYKAKTHESDLPARPDQEGVGQLVEMAIEKGRSTKAGLRCNICGEHGGDPSPVKFCHRTGLNYVSCSPLRVPIARLAAAQAALSNK